MRRGVGKLLLTTALVLLLATAIFACGGEDSDQTTATTTGQTERTAPTAAPEDSGSTESGPESGGEGSGSASFRTPGGDNSIQNYGEEADDEAREAASEAVAGFLRAREEGDWGAVCGYMASIALKPLEQLATQSPQLEGKDCSALLATLTGSAASSSYSNTLGGEIDSLRVKDDHAFALYHGTDGQDYFLQLVDEGGEWKVGALSPTALPG